MYLNKVTILRMFRNIGMEMEISTLSSLALISSKIIMGPLEPIDG